jgi:hypothetical protein
MLKSAYTKHEGIVYFPRMLQKIRLKEAGELPEEYHPYLGAGFDGRCCSFLNIEYEKVVAQVNSGKTDEEVFEWCTVEGRKPGEEEILIWNEFMIKRGWRDTNLDPNQFEAYKDRYGHGDRPDILTYFDFFEVDEGRAK